MIPKPINAALTIEDLQSLIDSAVRESKTIEYKRQVDLETTKGKEKFLAGVCSFANTNGG